MKNILNFTAIILLLSSFITCNSDMIEKGLDSTEDPRRPEINVKQGDISIYNGDTFPFVFANGVSVNEASEPQLFTIENLGTADLEIIQVSIQGDNSNEFILEEPASLYIPAGTNTNFAISFAPEDTDSKTATVLIETNDFDEGEYIFTLTGRSNPVPDFIARRRKAGSPLIVTFEDRSLPAGEITSWEWDFQGDGIIDSTEQNPTHIYTNPGDYTVVLEVGISDNFNYKIKTNYISVLTPEKNIINSNFTGAIWVHGSDVDSDGDYDILGASRFDKELAWWQNVDISGPGTGDASEFQKNIIETDTIEYKNLYAIDIDQGNGIDVIALGYLSGNRLYLFTNDGTGNFTRSGYFGSAYIYPIYAADIDSDNEIDILTSEPPAWLENDGDEDFTEHTLDIGTLIQIYSVDLDEDLDMDIIGCTHSGSWYNPRYNIVWWENDGSENFNAKFVLTPESNEPYTLNIYDLNNDGNIDILVSGGGNNNISWWENDGSMNLTVHPIDTDLNGQEYYLSAYDIENDGDIDIIGVGPDSNEIIWWENDGGLIFTKHILDNNFNGASSISSADIDGDGVKEIIGAASDDNEIAWWETKVSEWYEHTVDGSFSGAFDVYAADMDSDGDSDIIGVGNEGITWWEFNEGIAISSHFFVESDSIISIFPIDIDKDNDIDILYSTDSEIICNINIDSTGENWEENVIDDDSNVDFITDGIIYAVELDGDNYIDIVVVSIGDSSDFKWWKHMDGFGNFNTGEVIDYLSYWGDQAGSIFHNDINNNGSNDLILSGTADGDIIWLNNDGNANFTQYSIDTANHYYDGYSLYSIDIDNDNDRDVICATEAEGPSPDVYSIIWWENTQSGNDIVWIEHIIDNTIEEARSVYSADIDNDGDMDILAALPGEYIEKNGQIIIWLNDGNQNFTKDIIKNKFYGVRSIKVADMDGDGDLDIITAADNANDITWWENNLLNYGS